MKILILALFGIFGIVFVLMLYPEPRPQNNGSLIRAARSGDLVAVKQLLASGANVEERGDTGGTALFYASGNDDLSIAEELVSNGADVNARDNEAKTPLFANLGNHKTSVEMLQFLLSKGALINHRDRFGRNALFISLDVGGSIEKTRILIENGVEINVKLVETGEFPLELAASWTDVGTLDLLLRSGADPNLQRNDGRTALMEACRQNSEDAVTLLLNFGARPDLKDSKGRKAQDFLPAESSVVRSLLDH